MEPSRTSIERARALILAWATEPWSDVALWLCDEPELRDLGGVDRVLLLGMAMHANLQWSSRDVRQVWVEGTGEGALWLRAPEPNPFLPEDPDGLAEPWTEPDRFSATLQGSGAVMLQHWLQTFPCYDGRCESAGERLVFADSVCELLALGLGPPSGWTIYHPVEGDRLRSAYCCGVDAVVVQRGGAGLLLAQGMYC